ncbi:restriction endonuclease subunit S [Sphaerotilus montanus]|uniref:Type I restriction enzyme S subunit n=1 Tax=Sphaerotilus montanus TaxID=522889 RepID=A0A7Y9R1G4_9BURK|nr:restriction endonuclease subunit S [Sphaerotilus montanus]NYG34561.1 type I restriction enzyme S subunit [Sphaerotilus montanus]NZD56656.1 restriction endonuclease subunit S [Sphaerotilus montanus]
MSFPKYEHYKDSGVEWLGEVPAHWDVKSIRRVAELNPSKSEAAHLGRETEVSFLPMEAVGDDGKLNLDRTRPIGEVETGYTFFKEGDVTIAKITPCFENGKGAVMTGLQNGFGFGTTELIVTRPKLGHVTNHFLHWLYLSTTFRKTAEAAMYGAGGQKRVPDDFVRDFVTAFPPISEQDTISAFLVRETTKLDALITEQRTLIDLLKEKRQAVISHAVTKGLDPRVPMKDSGVEWLGEVPAHWNMLALKRISPSQTVGIVVNPSEYVSSEGLPFIYGGDISEGCISYAGARRISLEDSERNKKTKLNAGDVLVVRVGAPGVAAVVPPECEGGNCASVMLVRKGDFCSDWLCFLLNSRVVRYQVEIVQYGAAQEQFNIAHAVEFVLPTPDVNEQKNISAYLGREATRIDALTAEAQTTIALLQERRSALISAAVTGKIDVRQHTTEAA